MDQNAIQLSLRFFQELEYSISLLSGVIVPDLSEFY